LWLDLQAKACTSSGNQAACEKNPVCQYSTEAKACARRTVAKPGADSYDDKVGSLMVSTVTGALPQESELMKRQIVPLHNNK